MFCEVATDNFHGTGYSLHQGKSHLVLGGSAEDSHDPDGVLAGVEQRQLCHNEPVGKPLTVKPQFHALYALSFPGQKAPIIAHIVSCHAVGVDVEVGEAQHLFFVPHLVALQDSAAHEHGSSELIFGEEMDAGDAVKNPVKVGARIELVEPQLPVLLQRSDFAFRPGYPVKARLKRVRIWHRLCRHLGEGIVYHKASPLNCRPLTNYTLMNPADPHTRRTFIHAATVASAVAASSPLRAAESPASQSFSRVIKTDVLVCGGGCAGIAAALSAARNGAKTLLIERAGFSGGIITTVGLPYFDGLIDKPSGRFVVKGIALELLHKLGVAKEGAKHIDDLRPDLITKFWGSVRIPNVEEFKILADELILKHSDNLTVLYHTVACDVEVNDGHISTVIIANKDGLSRVEARQVIDCTGDGDVAHWAGCPTIRSAPLMPLTMHFRIGNVVPVKETQPAAKSALIEAHKEGRLKNFYGPGLIFAFAKDECYVHATRVPADATNAADFTRAEIQGRKDAWTIFSEWKAKVPGFENSYFIMSGPYIGVRDTRRIVGRSTLTLDDLRNTTRHDDAIATGCWFLDIHPPETTIDKPFTGTGFQPNPYDISYGTLIPQKASNLLVAGRCHSASSDASASSRVTVTAMALGEAAGTAAALAVKSRTEVSSIGGVKVREALAMHGAGPFTDA